MFKQTHRKHRGVTCGIKTKEFNQKIGCGASTHPLYSLKFDEYSFKRLSNNNLVLDVVNFCPSCDRLYVSSNKLKLIK